LQAYNWLGNVRELENMVERALVLCGTGPIKPEHFPLDLDMSPASPVSPAPDSVALGPLVPAVEAFEARIIEQALAQTDGSKPKTAALLDISERTLWYKLKKYWPKEDA
jgi:two-component system response regulator AtoC